MPRAGPAPPAQPPPPTSEPPARRSQRRAPAPGDLETFDLDNISPDEDEDGEAGESTQAAVPGRDLGINNPDIVAPKKRKAGDVHYFFEKLEDNWQCKICKYVLL